MVDRYEPAINSENDFPPMDPDDEGEYVLYSDYAELEAERARLLVEIDILKDLLQQHQNYQTKQGDKT